MVAQRTSHYVTVEEWRALERASDAKHEYIDGQLYLMAGGSRAHATIALNVASALRAMLRGGPCTVYNSDIASRLSASRFVYPDVVVTCEECDAPIYEETEISSPRLAMEILSESTEGRDRGAKFGYYRDCPTMQEYVLVNMRERAVEVHRRTPADWVLFRTYGSAEEVEFASIGAHLGVDEIYDRTSVPASLPG